MAVDRNASREGGLGSDGRDEERAERVLPRVEGGLQLLAEAKEKRRKWRNMRCSGRTDILRKEIVQSPSAPMNIGRAWRIFEIGTRVRSSAQKWAMDF